VQEGEHRHPCAITGIFGLDSDPTAGCNGDMRLLAFLSVILAFATLYTLADTELGAAAFYTLTAFLCAFLGYCCLSIEALRDQIDRMKRPPPGPHDSPRR
jgi:hypothetical protein